MSSFCTALTLSLILKSKAMICSKITLLSIVAQLQGLVTLLGSVAHYYYSVFTLKDKNYQNEGFIVVIKLVTLKPEF